MLLFAVHLALLIIVLSKLSLLPHVSHPNLFDRVATLAQHLLCPHAKAVRDSLTVLGSSLDAVYHVTIAYSSTFADDAAGVKRLKAPSMSDILVGDNPRVHLHLKRIEAKGERRRFVVIEEASFKR